MPIAIYPAIVHPADKDGLFGVEVPGINIAASGESEVAAIKDAAAMLQEVIDDLSAEGEPVPEPVDVADLDASQGARIFLQALLPGRAERINVTLPQMLIKRIDAVAHNRSAFIGAAVLQRLREEG